MFLSPLTRSTFAVIVVIAVNVIGYGAVSSASLGSTSILMAAIPGYSWFSSPCLTRSICGSFTAFFVASSASQTFITNSRVVGLMASIVYGALAYLIFFLRYNLLQIIDGVGEDRGSDV